MNFLRVLVVMAAGLGSTWAARMTTDALLGSPAAISFAQSTGETAAGGAAPPAVPEMSREEMDAELKRAQAEISGKGNEAELREFRPTKPLPADLPIALPSDI
jgi:hypothetical protein